MTEARHAERVADCGPLVRVDRSREVAQCGGENPCARVTAQRGVHDVHSGSTGKPKGVVVTQANVLRLRCVQTEAWFGFGEAEV